MTDSNAQDPAAESSAPGAKGLSRRTVLRGAAYTVPAVTIVAMTAGSAEAASGDHTPPKDVENKTVSKPKDLAFTGSGPVTTVAAVGAAAVAAGVVLQRAGRHEADPEA